MGSCNNAVNDGPQTFIHEFINTEVRQTVPPFYKNHMETIFWGVIQFSSYHQQQMGIEPCKKEH